MKKEDFKLKDNELLPCPLCGGSLKMRINDATKEAGSYMWKGGATCSSCGVGISTGLYGWGFSVDEIERNIIESLNRRPK